MQRKQGLLAGIFFVALSVFILLVSSVRAAPPNFSSANLTTPGTTQTLALPPEADTAQVISLGSAVDPGTGKLVEGYAIIHRKLDARPAKPPKGGGTQCYAYISHGAKWKTVEPWVVNTTNTRGLPSQGTLDTVAQAIAKWEDATDGTVGDSTGNVDVLGNGATTSATLVADTQSPDNQNEVYFADISSSNAIAVTIVWGFFSGPPALREIVEWDQVYDDVDYDWSMDGAPNAMDLDNIVTHEIGHSVGMADLYESACSEETEYGYAARGETKKRSLESGDITGVNLLY